METIYKDCERCGSSVDVTDYSALQHKLVTGLLCDRCKKVTAWDGGRYVIDDTGY